MERFYGQILTPVAVRRFEESPDIDVAYDRGTKGRYRVNLFMQRGRRAMAIRGIPPGHVEFADLNLPPSVGLMAEARSGLVLVVGPTGCGKSTTLAALVHHINTTREDHIVTVEDPIEFVHDEDKCLIHQRQVGFDTESFSAALRHVVRQSPDVILIGEMRDRDTVETAVSAALTGHLILSTLHTTNVAQSVDRILTCFPPEARDLARAELAATLVGIVSMRLLPRKDGRGRVPAVEVLRSTPTVRRHIANGEFAELYDVMKRSDDLGMMTLNGSLAGLVRTGAISEGTALRCSQNEAELRLNLEGMATGIDSIDMRTRQTLDRDDDEDEPRW
jgi:twitching motility protein PilT